MWHQDSSSPATRAITIGGDQPQGPGIVLPSVLAHGSPRLGQALNLKVLESLKCTIFPLDSRSDASCAEAFTWIVRKLRCWNQAARPSRLRLSATAPRKTEQLNQAPRLYTARSLISRRIVHVFCLGQPFAFLRKFCKRLLPYRRP